MGPGVRHGYLQKTEGRGKREDDSIADCGMKMDQRRREHGSKSKDGRLPNEAIGLLQIIYP